MNPNNLLQLTKIILELKEKVKCPICLDFLNNTVELECTHSFCHACLQQLKLESSPQCPLCKKNITKRNILYKDHLADEISKFVDHTCQLIKETYAHEVEELAKLSNSTKKLQEIIDIAPQNISYLPTSNALSSAVPSTDFKKPDEFSRIAGKCKSYVNKKKQVQQLKILDFTNNDNKRKIVNWLNDNQKKLNILTQSPSFFDSDDDDFELPSISQVPVDRKRKCISKGRSQSLSLDETQKEPLLRRYHSLTEGLDDYDIEEVQSETLVKQVERKVLLDMLEDECLHNMEKLAKKSKEKTKRFKQNPLKPAKKSNENKINSLPNSESSTGWKRLKGVKKALEKATKEPKKLNISLQEAAGGSIKKSPKADTKKTPQKKRITEAKIFPKGNAQKSLLIKDSNKTKKSPKPGKSADNKENENIDSKAVDINDNSNGKTFNLSAIENYFEKNLEKVKVPPDKNTSDMEIEQINNSIEIVKDAVVVKGSNVKQNSDVDNSFDDQDIYLLPTQRTPSSTNQNNKICYITPVPIELKDIDNIAVLLRDNLESCISSSEKLDNFISQSLAECFSNLKTYVDKILIHRSEKKEQTMQTSQIEPVAKTTVAVQTNKIKTYSKMIQTNTLPKKEMSTKNIQTSQYALHSTKVQTDAALCVDQEIQVTQMSATGIPQKKTVEIGITESVSNSSSPLDTLTNRLKNIKRKKVNKSISSQAYNVEKSEVQVNEGNIRVSEKSGHNTKEQLKGVTSSGESKSKSQRITQDSYLVCSLLPTSSNKSENKISRKLTNGNTENRSFKRIRMPASDSDSDEDGKPSKKRFLRDDLTVKFLDTDRENSDDNTPESEKIDYDKYLLEVMERYGSPPPKSVKEQLRSQHTSQKELSDRKPNSQTELRHENRTSLTKMNSETPKSQKDSGDHIFTAQMAFQENLDKFEKEIFEFEHITKAPSTEYDLVENTPLLSPKAKIPRLPLNKKKYSKKNCMNEPLQILSRGSVSNNIPEQNDVFEHENNLHNLSQREPSTLNRNILDLPSQTEKCTDDVADILDDLRNDEDFFKSNMDVDEQDPDETVLPKQQSNVLSDLGNGITRTNVDDGVVFKVNTDKGESLNVTQENIDEVLENLNGFDNDDDIEDELKKISFTAEQEKLNESEKDKIRILQNIKLRSQNKVAENDRNAVIESSDVSEDELVETTPQKKKKMFKDRSVLDNVEDLDDNSLGVDTLEFCLPPPPGFDDGIANSPPPDDAGESPNNIADQRPQEGNISSLTPERLTDFIVTPDTMMYKEKEATQNEDTQQSLTFKPSFVTPNRPPKQTGNIIHSTARVSQIMINDTEDIFSPITKSTLKFTQPKYTPLVSTSRLSTKKSSLMTSTPNQKSILNYVKSSQESPSASQQKAKPCIMWSRIVGKDMNVFTQLEVKKLMTTSQSFNPRVTHLVVLVDEQGRIVSHTAKILTAIAAGIWVVRYEWVQDCLKMNRIVSEEPYEAMDSSGVPGPQIARLTRETKPLFKGYRFYCAPPLLTISRGDLENILKLSGGDIARNLNEFLREDGKINIILTESSASEDTEQFENLLQTYKAVTIDVEWLTICIGQYKLVSFRAFLVSGDDSNICDLGYPSTLIESVPMTLTEAM